MFLYFIYVPCKNIYRKHRPFETGKDYGEGESVVCFSFRQKREEEGGSCLLAVVTEKPALLLPSPTEVDRSRRFLLTNLDCVMNHLASCPSSTGCCGFSTHNFIVLLTSMGPTLLHSLTASNSYFTPLLLAFLLLVLASCFFNLRI